MTAKRKAGGPKLTRSEIIQVRFDPRLRWAAELTARVHRQTLSSFIEWAVISALPRVEVEKGLSAKVASDTT